VGRECSDVTCDDGLDNDADTYTDCDDHDCSRNGKVTVCGIENTDALCSDTVDNDDNAFVDCNDFGCSRSPWITVCCG
jgi:hypothetical protein